MSESHKESSVSRFVGAPFRWLGWSGVCVFVATLIPVLAYSMFAIYDERQAHLGEVTRHGWPIVYLERLPQHVMGDRWLIWKNTWLTLQSGRLAANISIVISIAVASAAFWRWRIAGGRWRQFSLREALVVTAILGVILSVCAAPYVQRRKEMGIATKLEKLGCEAIDFSMPTPWYLRPFADMGIINEEALLRYQMFRLTTPGFTNASELFDDNRRVVGADRILREAAPLLNRLTYCDCASVQNTDISDDGLQDFLSAWNRCRAADLHNSPNITDAGVRAIVTCWNNLDELVLSQSSITDEGLIELRRLPKLEKIHVFDAQHITIDGVARLVESSPALKFISFSADENDKRFPALVRAAKIRGVEIHDYPDSWSSDK